MRDSAKVISIVLAVAANMCPASVSAQQNTPGISGNWFDSQLSTSKIRIVQNQNEFLFTGNGVVEDGPLVGVGFDVSGNGHIIANSLDLNYSAKFLSGLSVIGHCSGILRKDDVIAWHCKDSNAFESKPTWVKE